MRLPEKKGFFVTSEVVSLGATAVVSLHNRLKSFLKEHTYLMQHLSLNHIKIYIMKIKINYTGNLIENNVKVRMILQK